ncbi:MAG: LuxR C-terminal-related transcriptional regulator [Myxococcota bacterium]|nr:LuxR C-terminal-related transcriptional regulator [Myxococcota bacterium]
MSSSPSRSILDDIPTPILLQQAGALVYANEAAIQLGRELGYEMSGESISAFSIMSMVPDGWEDDARALEQRLMHSQFAFQATSWTMLSADGQLVSMHGHVSRTRWQERPALLLSFRRVSTEPETQVQAPIALSPRESEVAGLLCSGYEAVNISEILGIRESTVRTHIRAIYRKTQSHTRLELLRKLGLS